MPKLRVALQQYLSPEEIATVSTSYDIVGDIAVLRPLSENSAVETFAERIISVHKNVKVVLSQEGKIAGDFRLRSLLYVAGEDRRTTLHQEYGCVFSVDLDKCYFSTRLSHERLRISKLVTLGETVVNMFAGVGCFSIMIVKHAKPNRIFSIDKNPEAFELMRRNINLNAVYGKVIPILGSSEKVVKHCLQGVADRVLMPLPVKTLQFLPSALLALKKSGGWIHLYDFQHAAKSEDAVEKSKAYVAGRLAWRGIKLECASSRVVRSVGPRWYQTVLDLHATGKS